ncbi:DNA-processing protein DprA [Agarilytica rhodophyticola]|uniref:DNA-processing protein DprA n=1 Tax=Agarilytica rhodophyticola TaxID=1737490 RepID=UPI000B344446|nr:DNA-processing protein DprA [Agarilytica rhodophyticola]
MSSSLHRILQLLNIPGVGVSTYWKLIDAFGDIDGVFAAPYEQLRRGLSDQIARQIIDIAAGKASDAKIDNIIERCQKNCIHLIDHYHHHYPDQLREIPKGPPLLYVRGSLAALNTTQLAVIGSRSCSQAGRNNAFNIASSLVHAGLAITSGLALGIDTQAHKGALAAKGATIAVMGSGIDQIYPHRNWQLAEDIIANGGALVSEFPLNTAPIPQNFPRRNRIISGLSVGTLVVEAAIKSGSLTTAKYALEQNREVFAIPGSISSPQSKGCHALIKQGAVLVETADDIVRELEGFVIPSIDISHHKKAKPELTEIENKVLDNVEYDTCSIDELAQRSQLSIGELLATLMSLELKGMVGQEPSGYTKLV